MPEPAPRPEPPAPKLRADARRNREKVLHAARDAFAESGSDVPLDEIAARAGVGAGTVSRHFPSKEALFEAVISARIEDLVAARAIPGAVQNAVRDALDLLLRRAQAAGA